VSGISKANVLCLASGCQCAEDFFVLLVDAEIQSCQSGQYYIRSNANQGEIVALIDLGVLGSKHSSAQR
jgi:hypothetical protein